jgi:hypothetical protein
VGAFVNFFWYILMALANEPLLVFISFLSLAVVLREKEVSALLIGSIALFLTFSYFLAPKTDPRVFVVKFFPLAAVLSSLYVGQRIVVPRKTFLYVALMFVILLAPVALTASRAEIQVGNVSLFSYPSWDPSGAIRQLVNAKQLSGKSVATNFGPVVIYFLADALKNGSKPIVLNHIEQVDGSSQDVQAFRNELNDVHCEALLYVSPPEMPPGNNFGAQVFSYLTETYNYSVFNIGQSDLYFFRLS